MKKKQTNYCPNCGERVNGAKFCPNCGIQQEDYGNANANTNENNNTITINVGANKENGKHTLTLDELIQKAQTEFEAKDFETLKQTAKEIQTNYPKSFYGWYFDAICIMESPIDGTLGKLAKGLTVFSNAMVATVESSAQRQAAEITSAGFQALGVLAMENFQGRIFKAIKCISGNHEEVSTQQKLSFLLLSNLMEKVWKAYHHKTVLGWFKSEKATVLENYETKLNSFIINLHNEIRETSSADCLEYKKFMGTNYGEYMGTLAKIRYRIFKVGSHPTRRETREILNKYAEYCPEHIKVKNSTNWKSPKVILRICSLIFAVICIIVFFIVISNNTPSDIPYGYPYYY